MKSPVSTAVAIAVGLIVLLGFFIPVAVLQNLREVLVGWAAILAGVAGLVAILNLVSAHWRKLTSAGKRDVYSLALLLAFVVTLAAGLWLTPANADYQRVVTAIQAPVEMSLLALLAFSLAYASLRLLQRRRDLMSVIFVISAVVFLFLFSGFLPAAGNVFGFLQRLPMAGARGILLGVAAGSVMTGLRILLGADRPYSG
ncbi:hypothetical protein ADN00_03120 [Ornatilinea apprima]|uniref:Uncharacterized protein n=1 Tax=Ornatilinea apprima TaxID=1134406 RepID=A0A0P6X8R5_9CHLR|nr:hypothetical protein [Ornatilinea apprima]KPL79332.1 hypothetical protein ADN00_03120 [Ornatilinea apprima]